MAYRAEEVMDVLYQRSKMTEKRLQVAIFKELVYGLDARERGVPHGCRINEAAGVINQIFPRNKRA